ncbi:hypothetical protein HGA91_01675 [candidate division WWE3 bacterium]|nr:hypothetical protein [candidate division WWE3 bacterium]
MTTNSTLELRARNVSRASKLGIVPNVGNPDRAKIVMRLHSIDQAALDAAFELFELTTSVGLNDVSFFDLVGICPEDAKKLRQRANGMKGYKARIAKREQAVQLEAKAAQQAVAKSTFEAEATERDERIREMQQDRTYRGFLLLRAKKMGIDTRTRETRLAEAVAQRNYALFTDWLDQIEAKQATSAQHRAPGGRTNVGNPNPKGPSNEQPLHKQGGGKKGKKVA